MTKHPKHQSESLGLDIGSSYIKVASVLKRLDKYVLQAYNVKKVPCYGGSPVKTEKLVEETLHEVDLYPEEVNLSISGSSVVVRFITMPKMTKEQVENALAFEAERYIPFSAGEVIMDFLILDTTQGGEMNILLAAAKKDFVQSQIELLHKIGIKINVVDINAFASFNAFTVFNKLSGEKGTAFLDLGHSNTNILISTDNMPRFMRAVQIGGKDINGAISEELHISPEDAESMRTSGSDGDMKKITPAMDVVLEELAKEIQLSFGYFENKYSKPVEHVYCSGGLVYQRGLVKYLGEKLGVPVAVWDPAERMELSESLSREAILPIAAQFAVSIGLSLR